MATRNLCFACNDEITLYRSGCQALDHFFHVDCFTCTTCGKSLAGSSFYTIDDKPYCETDYLTTVEKCASCDKPIMDRILKASGSNYHPGCFTCTSCKGHLDGVPFTMHAEQGVHCMDCYHDKFAPRCASCRKPIAPEAGKNETMRVIAMNKSFHVDCYRCEDCGLKLSSRIEGHECYPLDNRMLCKACNSAKLNKSRNAASTNIPTTSLQN